MIFMFSLFGTNNHEAYMYIIIGLTALTAAIAFFISYRRRGKSNLPAIPEDPDLKQILNEFDIATWSLNPYSGSFYFSSGIERITCCKARDLSTNPALWTRLVHPYDMLLVREADKDLLAGIKNILIYRIMLADGRIKWIQRLGVPFKDKNGKLHSITGLIIDVSEQKKVEEDMQQMAYYDTLTGLANRTMLKYYFTHCQASSRHFAQNLAIIFIDLDSFKMVNDKFGHKAGDMLLKMVATRLKFLLRGNDLLARLGGDEFVALLTRVSQESLTGVAERILSTFSEPFEIDGRSLIIGASLGISIYPDDGEDLTTLMQHADQAMYQAKKMGKNRYFFY
ncbi:MAG: sensor domain-containing diguanylate cyclase [Syntrophomonadaceae bacterium]|nr:sensor domain-containing diguanylate cyclase [Syntrophomonadaceae bacterium]